jgi:hypothetical protein
VRVRACVRADGGVPYLRGHHAVKLCCSALQAALLLPVLADSYQIHGLWSKQYVWYGDCCWLVCFSACFTASLLCSIALLAFVSAMHCWCFVRGCLFSDYSLIMHNQRHFHTVDVWRFADMVSVPEVARFLEK